MSQTQPQYPQSAEDFNRLTGEFKESDRFRKPMLFSVGRLQHTGNGTLASVKYPLVNGPDTNLGTAAILMMVLGIEPKGVQNVRLTSTVVGEILKYFAPFENDGKRHGNIEILQSARNYLLDIESAGDSDAQEDPDVPVASFIFDDEAPAGVEDSTLKLYGMSNRFFKPNTLNLTKIFTKLPNVSWLGDTPFDVEDVDWALTASAFGDFDYDPDLVDKFPLYVHRMNVAKLGVRITDKFKVRLGAYLGEGTTLMAGASYVNFNAGTDGASMVEGRISSSAFVGQGSDIGGGASMLGTLSGGNSVPISVGRNCLLEVNSSLGIPVGDAVVIAAETAIMAGSMVQVNIQDHPLKGSWVKARDLAGINAATFRRNDMTGLLEVVRTARNFEFARKLENGESILSADLHKND